MDMEPAARCDRVRQPAVARRAALRGREQRQAVRWRPVHPDGAGHRHGRTRPGQFALRSDGVYLVTAEALLRVGPDATVTPVVTGLGAQWYNDPQLVVDAGTGDVFTLRGRDLVRISLA